MNEDAPGTEMPEVKLKRIARPVYVLGALILVAAMVVVAFLAGTQIQSPQATNTAEETTALPVTAQVEMRVVQEGLQVPGKITAPETLDLKLAGEGSLGVVATTEEAPDPEGAGGEKQKGSEATEAAAPSGSDRNVISRMVAAEGNRLAAGDLLAEVSGRPVIAAPSGTPLYRDFVLGITGEDVLAVQQMLAGLGYVVDVDGILDADTMDTITYWYSQLGYELPKSGAGKRGLPWKELLPLPSGSLTVTTTGGSGTVLGGDTALMKVRRGDPVVEATVDAVQVGEFRDAKTVYVLFEGKSLEAEVLAIGDLKTDDDTGVSGHTVTVACPPDLAERSGEVTSVSIATAKPEEASFAVPVAAIDEDGQSQFVRLQPADTEAADSEERSAERVDIEVLAVSGGWAAIAENDKLPEGAEIRVQ
ncbi:hypothetical protein [Leucobacter sp. wl10]|uniref:hypothetical protein n=1 Tax=Leucobacter sp. wl10 TaxID=2304677 RepID=UPI000E5B1184|nr:hypothetical protein [Leucobacter sp. wl10]RGE18036.1 hypothetical protein D1J51_14890 [Leucobacter sp. wl10]